MVLFSCLIPSGFKYQLFLNTKESFFYQLISKDNSSKFLGFFDIILRKVRELGYNNSGMRFPHAADFLSLFYLDLENFEFTYSHGNFHWNLLADLFVHEGASYGAD